MKRLVTVIVVNWNGKMCLSQCLNALRKQSFQEMNVVVVDNGSTDGSTEVVRQLYPEVSLLALKDNLGFAAANNIVICQVETEYVALLNNDAIADPYWLENLLSALSVNPEAGFAASKMLYQEAPHLIDRAGDGYTMAGAGSLRGRGRDAHEFDKSEWAFGACAGAALYRKSMIRDVGLFDEDFFLLYEDVDLSFRAQLKGYKCLYVPNAIVYHMSCHSIGYDSPTSVYFGHRNLEWVYFQNMPFALLMCTLVRHFLYVLACGVYFSIKGLGMVFFRSKWDSIRAWKVVLRKRKKIQAQRRVGDDYIRSLLESERILTRLSHRLKRQNREKVTCA